MSLSCQMMGRDGAGPSQILAAKILNRTIWNMSNRTHENKITTQFIGRREPSAQQRSFCSGCEDLPGDRSGYLVSLRTRGKSCAAER